MTGRQPEIFQRTQSGKQKLRRTHLAIRTSKSSKMNGAPGDLLNAQPRCLSHYMSIKFYPLTALTFLPFLILPLKSYFFANDVMTDERINERYMIISFPREEGVRLSVFQIIPKLL